MNTDYATRSDVAGLKAEIAGVKTEVDAVKIELGTLRIEMLERLEKVETRLLTEFHKYARATESRTIRFGS